MSTKPSVYVETTVVSYLVARPSRDLIVAAHQQLTAEWWLRRASFELFASQPVLREAAAGDPDLAKRRLELLDNVPVLASDEAALSLAEALLGKGVVPRKAAEDATHIAIATVNGIDYLVTWNCKHIANALIERRIAQVCGALGYEPPVICTPEELMED